MLWLLFVWLMLACSHVMAFICLVDIGLFIVNAWIMVFLALNLIYIYIALITCKDISLFCQ